MGIRIKKMMGFGLIDIQTDSDDCLNDNRFNTEGIMVERFNDKFNTKNVLKHYTSVLNKSETDDNYKHNYELLQIKNISPKPTGNILYYDEQCGLPNVMCLVPLSHPLWVRSDDDIDYHNERIHGYWSVDPHVEILTTPIYPYVGYVNNETGQPADKMVFEWIYQFRNAELNILTKHPTNSDKIIECNQVLSQHALDELGCELHWTEKWNVQLPQEIIEFCRFTKMFNNESDIWKLQPMIYTYWS